MFCEGLKFEMQILCPNVKTFMIHISRTTNAVKTFDPSLELKLYGSYLMERPSSSLGDAFENSNFWGWALNGHYAMFSVEKQH